MQLSQVFAGRRAVIIFAIAAVVVVLAVGLGFAFQPITRDVISRDILCEYCHLEREYDATVRLSMTKPHKATHDGGQARCIDCHLPKGFVASAFAYTHYLSATDLFGHFRDREGERAGAWIPMSAARAYRVRDRLFKDNSVTCRSCHIESEIKPKKKRGQKAHEGAIKNKDTCIECHFNLVHREVEVRDTAFEHPDKKKKKK